MLFIGLFPYVRELAAHYDLALVNIAGRFEKTPETSLFKKVLTIRADHGGMDIAPIMKNNFQLAYYPDVGMSQESIYLSNMRLAPIQAMGTGHPVSSTSKAMDYFISGAEVETAAAPEKNYDERLVLLPGLSVHPVHPSYQPAFPELDDSVCIVNCPWAHMKNNSFMAGNLKKVLDQVEKKVCFHTYPGNGMVRNNGFMATVYDYSRILPVDSFLVVEDLPYADYMARQEKGRFCLHSYPFGGGTTAVDALILGKPLVVLRGGNEYNRYAAALLHRISLDELVADTVEQWSAIVVRLVNDSAYLTETAAKVRSADLEARLFRVEDAACLDAAFTYLIRNHDALKKDDSRAPIRIA